MFNFFLVRFILDALYKFNCYYYSKLIKTHCFKNELVGQSSYASVIGVLCSRLQFKVISYYVQRLISISSFCIVPIIYQTTLTGRCVWTIYNAVYYCWYFCWLIENVFFIIITYRFTYDHNIYCCVLITLYVIHFVYSVI